MDVVGLAASIATLLRLGHEIFIRVQELRDYDNPFSDVANCLPLILFKVREIEVLYSRGSFSTENEVGLKAAVDGCKRNLERLKSILASFSIPPSGTANSVTRVQRRLWGALKSFKKESEVYKIRLILQNYESTFSFFFMDLQIPSSATKSEGIDGRETIYEVPSAITDFVGRGALLESIKRRLHAEGTVYDRTAVLFGLGGQGKTQLALECCRQLRKTQSIIYVNALSPGTLQRSFEQIKRKHIKTTTEAASDSGAHEIYQILDSTKFPFTVVLDNLDQPAAFDDISRYLPNSEKASVIITTRNIACERLGKMIEVDSMTVHDAVQLLSRRIGKSYDEKSEEYDTATTIVDKLGQLPLAIDQAGTYMRARNLTPRVFLQHYTSRRDVILRETPEVWWYSRKIRDSEKQTHLSVFTTWELSFDQLDRTELGRSKYAHTLTLAAFTDFSRASEVLFELDAKAAGETWSSADHQDAVALLRSISLISHVEYIGSNIYFSLHPLVAEWLRARLSPDEVREYRVRVMNALLQFSESWLYSKKNWNVLDQTEMISHLDRFASETGSQLDEDHKDDASLLQDGPAKLCRFYLRHNRFVEAEAFARTCIAGRIGGGRAPFQIIIGEIHLMVRGDLEEADSLLSQATKAIERVHGFEHPETLHSFCVLAFCRFTQSRFEYAEDIYARVYAERQRSLGHEHIDTLDVARMLGETYRLQRNYHEAYQILTRVVETFGDLCGPSHYWTATAVSSLATLHRDQGQFDLAQRMFERCVEIFEQTFGPCSGVTCGAYIKLGFVLEDQGRLDGAIPLYIKALQPNENEPNQRPPGDNAAMALVARLKRLIKDFRNDLGLLGQSVIKASLADLHSRDIILQVLSDLENASSRQSSKLATGSSNMSHLGPDSI